jgi:hypothetical protein
MAFREKNSGGSSSGNNLTVSAPAGLAAGDVLIASCANDNNADGAALLPTGFTARTAQTSTHDGMKMSCGHLVVASPAASYQFLTGTSEKVALLAAYSGIDNTTPIHQGNQTSSSSDATSATTQNMSVTSVTTTQTCDFVFIASADWVSNNATKSYAPPTNYSERVDTTSGAATPFVSIHLSDRVAQGATASGTVTGVATNGVASTAGYGAFWLALLNTAAGGAYTITADRATFTETGNAAGLTAQRKVTADTQSYALTGIAAGLKRGYPMPAATGSHTLTGNAAGLAAGRKISAEQGAYTLTGADAGLTYTPAVAAYTMNADAVAFTLTGNDAAFAYTPVVRVVGGGRFEKRWWKINGRLYYGTEESCNKIAATDGPEEVPQPKKQAKKHKPAPVVELISIPQLEYEAVMFTPVVYETRDDPMALKILEAIRKRFEEDEEEIELLLLH